MIDADENGNDVRLRIPQVAFDTRQKIFGTVARNAAVEKLHARVLRVSCDLVVITAQAVAILPIASAVRYAVAVE